MININRDIIKKTKLILCQSTATSRKTRAQRGTDRSPEYIEHCYKLDSRVKYLTTEWNEKQQHFITHVSRSLLWIQFFCCSLPVWRRSILKKDPPSPWPILPRPGSAPRQIRPNMFMHVPGHEYFIPTKFRKHPSSGYVGKADNCSLEPSAQVS